jgi:hypothetical protein
MTTVLLACPPDSKGLSGATYGTSGAVVVAPETTGGAEAAMMKAFIV